MKISENKLRLGFYAYFSIISVTVFLVTAVAEQILPTQIIVKSLILMSLFVFFGGVFIYIINQTIKKSIIIFILGAMFIGLFVLYITGDYGKEINIYNQIRGNLNKYIGVEYRKDFELNTGIDDDGLIHATLWQSYLQAGLVNKNFSYISKAAYIWWQTFDKDNGSYNENIYEKIDKINKDFKFETGDVIILNGNSYVFYKMHKNSYIWVSCDAAVKKFYFNDKYFLDNIDAIFRIKN